MGLQLSSCGNCDGCSTLCSRDRLDRCCSMCMGAHNTGLASAASSATIVAAHDQLSARKGRPEVMHYEACPDTGVVLSVRHPGGCDVSEECGEWRPRDCAAVDEGDEQQRADASGYEDEVMSWGPPPVRLDVPNIGECKPLTALEDECRFNAGKLSKIRRLAAQGYGHWRPVRGDGNCYYRTVIFGALEAILSSSDSGRMRQLVAALREVQYEDPDEHRDHGEMLRRLQRSNDLGQLEHRIAQDPVLDLALIRACRRLVRLFLMKKAAEPAPNGLTYSEMVTALDSAYTSMEAFCTSVVDPMGRDAETLALDALPLQLGVGLRLWILDRRDEVDLVNLDTLGPDGKVDVHVLFKPGHYDLLYLRKPGKEEKSPT